MTFGYEFKYAMNIKFPYFRLPKWTVELTVQAIQFEI